MLELCVDPFDCIQDMLSVRNGSPNPSPLEFFWQRREWFLTSAPKSTNKNSRDTPRILGQLLISYSQMLLNTDPGLVHSAPWWSQDLWITGGGKYTTTGFQAGGEQHHFYPDGDWRSASVKALNYAPELQLDSSPIQEDGGRLVVDSWNKSRTK